MATSGSPPIDQYTYFTFKGNNDALIKRALSMRPWWRDICEEEEAVIKLDYTLKTANMASNSKSKKSIRKMKQQKVFELHLEKFSSQEFNFCWRSTLSLGAFSETGRLLTMHSVPPVNGFGISEDIRKKQMVNHFATLKDLTTKTGLLRSLTAFCTSNDLNVFDITPLTYLVVTNVGVGVHNEGAKAVGEGPSSNTVASAAANHDIEDSSWNSFKDRFKQYGRLHFEESPMPEGHCHHNMWIIKPSGLNCGRGIQVFQELSAIKKFMLSVDGEYVVQKYLERPLLLWGRKFDMRIWVVLTQDCDIYMYTNGYIRTSSEKFTLNLKGASATDKQMVHLTNYCMQKHSANIGKFEEGNTLSYSDLQNYLNEFHASAGINLEEHIISRIKVAIVDSLLAAFGSMNEGNLGRENFELFGYDFMIDEDFRVWLIEVNTNPFLGVQNNWHGKLLEEMTEDLVSLVIDEKFPNPNGDIKFETPKRENGFKMLYSASTSEAYKSQLPGPRDESWYYPIGKSMTVETHVGKGLIHPSPRSPISPRNMENKYKFNKNASERIKEYKAKLLKDAEENHTTIKPIKLRQVRAASFVCSESKSSSPNTANTPPTHRQRNLSVSSSQSEPMFNTEVKEEVKEFESKAVPQKEEKENENENTKDKERETEAFKMENVTSSLEEVVSENNNTHDAKQESKSVLVPKATYNTRSQIQWNLNILDTVLEMSCENENEFKSNLGSCKHAYPSTSSLHSVEGDKPNGRDGQEIYSTMANMNEEQKTKSVDDALKNISKIIANSKILETAIRCGCLKTLWNVVHESENIHITSSSRNRAISLLKYLYKNYVRICPKIHSSTPLPEMSNLVSKCLNKNIISSIEEASDENYSNANEKEEEINSDNNKGELSYDANDERKSNDFLMCLSLRLLEMVVSRNRISSANNEIVSNLLLVSAVMKAYGGKESAAAAQNLLNKFSASEMKTSIATIDATFVPESVLPKLQMLLKDEVLQKKRDRERQKSELQMLKSKDDEKNSEALRQKLQEWQSKIDAERAEERGRYLALKKKAEEEEALKAKDIEESEKQMRLAKEAEIKKKAKMFAKMHREIDEQKKLQAIEQALKAEEESLRRQKMVEEHVNKWLKDKKAEVKQKEIEETKDAMQLTMANPNKGFFKRGQVERSIKLDVKRRSILAKKSLIRAQEKRYRAFQNQRNEDSNIMPILTDRQIDI